MPGSVARSSRKHRPSDWSITHLLPNLWPVPEHLRDNVGCGRQLDRRPPGLASGDSVEDIAEAFVLAPVDELLAVVALLLVDGLGALEQLPDLDELLHDRGTARRRIGRKWGQ